VSKNGGEKKVPCRYTYGRGKANTTLKIILQKVKQNSWARSGAQGGEVREENASTNREPET